jgi:hypothetical protein
MTANKKKYLIVLILGTVLGIFSGHDFYLGRNKQASGKLSLVVASFAIVLLGMIFESMISSSLSFIRWLFLVPAVIRLGLFAFDIVLILLKKYKDVNGVVVSPLPPVIDSENNETPTPTN